MFIVLDLYNIQMTSHYLPRGEVLLRAFWEQVKEKRAKLEVMVYSAYTLLLDLVNQTRDEFW